MTRTALFANAFNDIIQTARQEADQQKEAIEKQLEEARGSLETAQAKVADLEKQLSDIDDELAVGLVAAARNAGIKIDLKRAAAAVSQPQPGAAPKATKTDSSQERAAVMALLNKQRGQWVPSTEIKETTGVERPISVLLKNAEGIESQGKGRGVQYRVM